jgi:hypothetical protein
MDALPNHMTLIRGQSDPLITTAAHANWTLVDILSVGFSPIAIECNEAWKPLLDKACERFGYCWEWIAAANQPAADHPTWVEHPWLSRDGIAVMRKV